LIDSAKSQQSAGFLFLNPDITFRVATVIKGVSPAPTCIEHEVDHPAYWRRCVEGVSCTRSAPWHSRHRTDAPLDDELLRLAAKVVHTSADSEYSHQSGQRFSRQVGHLMARQTGHLFS
jgi:hypothetical protein